MKSLFDEKQGLTPEEKALKKNASCDLEKAKSKCETAGIVEEIKTRKNGENLVLPKSFQKKKESVKMKATSKQADLYGL